MNNTVPFCSIAMITDDFLPAGTGVGVHVQKMSREMVARGHRVTVITTCRKGQPAEEMWEGVTVYRVFSIPIYGFYQALPLRKTLRQILFQNSIGIVHCHYLSIMMLRMIRVAKAMGIPTVLTAHMTVDHLTQPVLMKPWRPLLSRCIARIYEKFGDIICVSAEYARQVERFSISSQVHFISNPIDFDGTEVVNVPSWNNFRIFFAGRLNPEKNIQLLLRAFKLLVEKGANAELWIAGQGAQEKELRQLTESLGLTKHVKFLGQVKHNDLPGLYSTCDVFVLPSLVETQGLVALEAMRFLRPVIVTNKIISARELVDDGKNGFIVDADHPQELAERLNRLRNDSDLRRKQGEAGFERSAGYTVTAVANALEKVYQTVGVDAALRIDTNDFHLDKRQRCAFCQVGTFERRAEHMIIAADAHRFQEEYFAVWRCATCRSLHALAKFSLDEYYRNSPFLKRKLNRYNRVAFEGFYRWLLKKGAGPKSRVLFYGVNSAMFQDFFREKGYESFDTFEEVMSEEKLSAQTVGSYDAVIILDYLERAEDPRLVFEFAKRQLREGGMLILHTPDAEKITMPFKAAIQMHQPFRLHIASRMALESLAQAKGFEKKVLERYHYLDTLTPFINYRAFHDLPFFFDGSMESGFNFRPRDVFRKVWRIPRFIVLGLCGGFFREPSNLVVVFTKK